MILSDAVYLASGGVKGSSNPFVLVLVGIAMVAIMIVIVLRRR
jgi:LPXTG-motif cell wall-anchored protein